MQSNPKGELLRVYFVAAEPSEGYSTRATSTLDDGWINEIHQLVTTARLIDTYITGGRQDDAEQIIYTLGKS